MELLGIILMVVGAAAFILALISEKPWMLLGLPVLMIGAVMMFTSYEGPECSKVYNPDGSYVETCEYPGDE